MKIALIYDRLATQFGGAEEVLLALHETFPSAPLYTSIYDERQARWASAFTVKTSFLQRLPFAKKFPRLFVGLMPLAFEQLDLSEFDIILSVTSAEAKGVLTKPNQLHVCYLLTPTRYLWSHYAEYTNDRATGWFRKSIFQYLRWWDSTAALRPDYIIPISHHVAQRCKTYYGRETEPVIYPPVRLTFFKNEKNTTERFYLIVSRLVEYKRIDLAIEACQKLKRKLVIIGDGPDLMRLKAIAQTHSAPPSLITFLGAVQSQQVEAYYTSCSAFLSPAEEDFGITILEALSAGKPVIPYKGSGGAEVVEENKTGVFLKEQTITSLIAAIEKSESISWDSEYIQKSVRKYSVHEFEIHIQKALENLKNRYEQKGLHER